MEDCLMVTLQPGNCQLKPSQRRQLLSWLKRTDRAGRAVGDFFLTISIRRLSGRRYELHTDVRDAIGDFTLRTRGQTWRDVCRTMVRMLAIRLHDRRSSPAIDGNPHRDSCGHRTQTLHWAA